MTEPRGEHRIPSTDLPRVTTANVQSFGDSVTLGTGATTFLKGGSCFLQLLIQASDFIGKDRHLRLERVHLSGLFFP